jgi:hypothetical protein
MAPTEETTSATCSQPVQDETGAKLQQDSPKVQQGVPSNFEENITHSKSPSCKGTVDPVLDVPRNVTTNGTENINSLVESQNSNTYVDVENISPHGNSVKIVSDNSTENNNSVVDRHETIDRHILDSSQSVDTTDQVVDSPDICTAVSESVCPDGSGSESVVNIKKRHNQQILSGSKKVATNYAENVEKVMIISECATDTNLDNVNLGVECSASDSSVVLEDRDKVVDNSKCIAFATMEDDEIMDKPKDRGGSADNTTSVESIACAVSVSEQEIGVKNVNEDSHVTVAATIDDIDIAKKGKDVGIFYFLIFCLI